jgi:hypothetical protein
LTDTTTAPVTVPPLLETLLHDYAQKGLTILATAAAGNGLIASTQEAQMVSDGVAIVLFGVSFAWTYLAAKLRVARLAAAIAQPAPKEV